MATLNKPYSFNTSPAARLAYYKAYAAQRTGYDTWKDACWQKPTILANGKDSLSWNEKQNVLYVDSLENAPVVLAGDAHTLAKIDHTGWYVDQFCDDVLKGAVVAIRNPRTLNGEDDNTGNKTHLQFYPATYCTAWDGATIYISEVYETAREAAYRADRIAERLAEDEREYQAKEQAQIDIDEAKAEIHKMNREFLALRAETKQAGQSYTPHVCEAIREKLSDILDERERLFDRIAKLQDNFWFAVE